MSEPRPIIDRLMAKVRPTPSGCWQFTGHVAPNGYGQVGRGRRGAGVAYAHRVAYEYYVGPIPEGLDLDHLCRNRACVNPEHLDAVTRRINLLRGRGWTAVNAAKTHCVRGHEFTGENTRRDKRGGRQCRACDSIRNSRKRAAA